MAEMEKIPQHKHCYVCGKAHTGDEKFCGGTCKETKKVEISKKKRQYLIIYVILVAVAIGAILFA
jgi:predicted nucleic acid-binding Zn ribbon protein